jgi:hypothetical protein
MKIQKLMQVAPKARDLGWLQESLQAAIELEHATLPPYLCALWSIKDPKDCPVYKRILSIAMDEMFHMGLVCNLLTTLGGRPRIANEDFIPKYPAPLPGGVRPELIVPLQGLSIQALRDTFMEIEYPEGGPVALRRNEQYTTIGEFYNAILDAFRELPATAITGQGQVTCKQGEWELYAIKDYKDAQRAISQIKQEGEGSNRSPYVDEKQPKKLAHYYKFKEVEQGRELVPQGDKWEFVGEKIPFPAVFLMAPVPKGGYPESSDSREFDEAYTQVLKWLEDAWTGGGNSKLEEAIGAMYGLGEYAQKLMNKDLPGGQGTLGPSFRFVPEAVQRLRPGSERGTPSVRRATRP